MSKSPAERWGFGEVEADPDPWSGRVQMSEAERAALRREAEAALAEHQATHQLYALRAGLALLRTVEAASDEVALEALGWRAEPGTSVVHSASGRVVAEAPLLPEAPPAPPRAW